MKSVKYVQLFQYTTDTEVALDAIYYRDILDFSDCDTEDESQDGAEDEEDDGDDTYDEDSANIKRTDNEGAIDSEDSMETLGMQLLSQIKKY